jgi:hypothetical protein
MLFMNIEFMHLQGTARRLQDLYIVLPAAVHVGNTSYDITKNFTPVINNATFWKRELKQTSSDLATTWSLDVASEQAWR